jgi:hypothetical protein
MFLREKKKIFFALGEQKPQQQQQLIEMENFLIKRNFELLPARKIMTLPPSKKTLIMMIMT